MRSCVRKTQLLRAVKHLRRVNPAPREDVCPGAFLEGMGLQLPAHRASGQVNYRTVVRSRIVKHAEGEEESGALIEDPAALLF